MAISNSVRNISLEESNDIRHQLPDYELVAVFGIIKVDKKNRSRIVTGDKLAKKMCDECNNITLPIETPRQTIEDRIQQYAQFYQNPENVEKSPFEKNAGEVFEEMLSKGGEHAEVAQKFASLLFGS